MGATLANIPCEDHRAVLRDCQALRLPTDWDGLPTQFVCPLGMTPGIGWCLLRRASLDQLDLNALHTLVIDDGGGPTHPPSRVTLRSLLVVSARAVSPGWEDDPLTPYLVCLADRRWLLRRRTIDRAYNVRSYPGASTFLAPTLDAGLPWTWSRMVQSIWEAIGTGTGSAGLGPWPGLPFTPDGQPDGWNFFGSSAWLALARVLARLACALRLDPVADTFSIVRLAVADPVADAAADRRKPIRVWDAYWVEPAAARLPGLIRVRFHKEDAPNDGSSWFHLIDVAVSDAGAAAGGVELVEDDLPALVDVVSGVVTNVAALTVRAAERAADWLRQARLVDLDRSYTGELDDVGLRPGARVTTTRWIDTPRADAVGEHALLTPVARRRGGPPPFPWSPDRQGDGGGGGSASGGGLGGPASKCCDGPTELVDCCDGPDHAVVVTYRTGETVKYEEGSRIDLGTLIDYRGQKVTFGVDQNDLKITSPLVILDPTADGLQITGFDLTSLILLTGSPEFRLINITANKVYIPNNDAGSKVGNRVNTNTGGKYTVDRGSSINLTRLPTALTGLGQPVYKTGVMGYGDGTPSSSGDIAATLRQRLSVPYSLFSTPLAQTVDLPGGAYGRHQGIANVACWVKTAFTPTGGVSPWSLDFDIINSATTVFGLTGVDPTVLDSAADSGGLVVPGMFATKRTETWKIRASIVGAAVTLVAGEVILSYDLVDLGS